MAIRDGNWRRRSSSSPAVRRPAIDILVAKLRNGTDPAQHDNFLTPKLITKDNLARPSGRSRQASPHRSPARPRRESALNANNRPR